jgi:hypothetical protein
MAGELALASYVLKQNLFSEGEMEFGERPRTLRNQLFTLIAGFERF